MGPSKGFIVSLIGVALGVIGLLVTLLGIVTGSAREIGSLTATIIEQEKRHDDRAASHEKQMDRLRENTQAMYDSIIQWSMSHGED